MTELTLQEKYQWLMDKAGLPEPIQVLISEMDGKKFKQADLIKVYFISELSKFKKTLACNQAKVNDNHEVNIQTKAVNLVSQEKEELFAHFDDCIGNSNQKDLRYITKLSDDRRMDFTITATRLVPLKSHEIIRPTVLLEKMKKAVDSVSLAKTIDLISLRKRSVGGIKADKQISDKMFRYNIKYTIRERTQKEEKSDATA